jgi:muramidase (phage lysozyme)
MKEEQAIDIIQEAKAISTEFKEIETEYNSPDSLVDTGNWYYISKKQDEVISRLVNRLEEMELAMDMNMHLNVGKLEKALRNVALSPVGGK